MQRTDECNSGDKDKDDESQGSDDEDQGSGDSKEEAGGSSGGVGSTLNEDKPKLHTLPQGLQPKDLVYAITYSQGHTCMALPVVEDVQSESTVPSSASQFAKKLQLAGKKSKRSLTAKHLATALRQRFESTGGTWTLANIRAEVSLVDPGAKALSAHVLRMLREGTCAISTEVDMELIQGFAVCLRRKGFGVSLHITDAEGVRMQVRFMCTHACRTVRVQGKM